MPDDTTQAWQVQCRSAAGIFTITVHAADQDRAAYKVWAFARTPYAAGKYGAGLIVTAVRRAGRGTGLVQLYGDAPVTA